MIEIKDLLSEWSDKLLSGEVKKETIRNIISQIIGVDINTEQIKIQNNTIYLDIKPIYKNEILMKRDEIFLKLEKSFGKSSPRNIR